MLPSLCYHSNTTDYCGLQNSSSSSSNSSQYLCFHSRCEDPILNSPTFNSPHYPSNLSSAEWPRSFEVFDILENSPTQTDDTVKMDDDGDRLMMMILTPTLETTDMNIIRDRECLRKTEPIIIKNELLYEQPLPPMKDEDLNDNQTTQASENEDLPVNSLNNDDNENAGFHCDSQENTGVCCSMNENCRNCYTLSNHSFPLDPSSCIGSLYNDHQGQQQPPPVDQDSFLATETRRNNWRDNVDFVVDVCLGCNQCLDKQQQRHVKLEETGYSYNNAHQLNGISQDSKIAMIDNDDYIMKTELIKQEKKAVTTTYQTLLLDPTTEPGCYWNNHDDEGTENSCSQKHPSDLSDDYWESSSSSSEMRQFGLRCNNSTYHDHHHHRSKRHSRSLIKPTQITVSTLLSVMPAVIHQFPKTSRIGLCRQLKGKLYNNSPQPSPNFIINTLIPVFLAAHRLSFQWHLHSCNSLAFLKSWVFNHPNGKELLNRVRIDYHAPTSSSSSSCSSFDYNEHLNHHKQRHHDDSDDYYSYCINRDFASHQDINDNHNRSYHHYYYHY